MKKLPFLILSTLCLIQFGCAPTGGIPDPQGEDPGNETPLIYTVEYIAQENGSISGQTTQLIPANGTGSEVVAIPEAGYHFTTWDDGLTTASRTETSVTADATHTAHFELSLDQETPIFSIEYIAAENGSISGQTTQLIPANGTGSEVVATPEAGYHFTTWDDGLTTASRTETSVTADATHTAHFELNLDQETPTFSPDSGPITFGDTVTISATGADAIYYTTDGSTPSNQAGGSTQLYSDPIIISGVVTVKALAVRTNYNDSPVGSASYTQAIASAPSAITLGVGSSNPVGGVTNVAIPADGDTDTTGAVSGWVESSANTITFTVTDTGSAVSSITIGGSEYLSGNDYAILSTTSLNIVVTTLETGKQTTVRYFTVSVSSPTTATITQSSGTAQYAYQRMGQTFQLPQSGTLNSIELTFAMRGTFVGTGQLTIYSDPSRTTTIGTATNTINDTTDGEFTSVTGTFNFSGINLAANTSYYFELIDIANSNAIYLWQVSSNPYSGGSAYGGSLGATASLLGSGAVDCQFVITYTY